MSNCTQHPVALVLFSNARALDRLLRHADPLRITKNQTGAQLEYRPPNRHYAFYFQAMPLDHRDMMTIMPFLTRSLSVVSVFMLDEELTSRQFEMVYEIADQLGMREEPTYLLEITV